jgi:sigma-B regulation protein RsbU (phosphoserine phosphatase)
MEIVPPADVLDQLSERFPLSKSVDNRYFTIHYGIIDLRTGRYKYAQGGHPPAILVSRDRSPRLLEGSGLPIGFDPSIKYDQFEIALSRGDRLVLYSDGITETNGKNREQFGDERLLAATGETHALPVKEALSVILDRLTEWRGKSQPEDDISILAIDWMADLAPPPPGSSESIHEGPTRSD